MKYVSLIVNLQIWSAVYEFVYFVMQFEESSVC